MVEPEKSERPELRLSDADRERAVQRLQEAVAEGRLTMAEFEERVGRALAARTASELVPFLADLPTGALAQPPEQGVIRNTAGSVTRRGRWLVPRRLAVHSKAGSVKLDFTEAVISHPVIDVDIDSYAGSTTLVLPPGASVDVEPLESHQVAASVRVRRVPISGTPAGRPHVVLTGRQWAGSVVVRYQRRFLRWRW